MTGILTVSLKTPTKIPYTITSFTRHGKIAAPFAERIT